MRLTIHALALLALMVGLSACYEPKQGDPTITDTSGMTAMQARIAELKTLPEVPELRIKVSHILVKVVKDAAGEVTDEAYKAAEKKASDLYDRVMAGEDFDTLATKFSDDGKAGKPKNSYGMWQKVPPQNGETERTGMVPAFGNVGWKLKVGEVGVAPYDKDESPYGWHIIKRIE